MAGEECVQSERAAPIARGGPFASGSGVDDRRSVEPNDVLRGGTLRPVDEIELDPLTLREGLESLHLDRGVVHEAVTGAALGRDETEPLRVIEPLDRTDVTHTSLCEE